MNYLKTFEEAQIKWYKKGSFDNPIETTIDDDDNIIIINNSPIKNLRFGKDGELFKCGDRVIIKRKIDRYYQKGTIITCYLGVGGNENYLICFDEDFSTGNAYKKYNIPDGHGAWIYSYELHYVQLL